MDATATFFDPRHPAGRRLWLLALAGLVAVGAAEASDDQGADATGAAAAAAPQAAASAPASGGPAPKPYGSGYEARGLAASGSQPAGAGEARVMPQRAVDRFPSSHRHGGGAGRGGRR